MAAIGQQVTITTAATLIFEIVDGETYNALTSPAPNIFKAGTSGDPLPILLILPTASTIFLGGSIVTSSSTNIGAAITGVPTLAYNAIGGDSLYGIVASSTAIISILVLRQ